jgi:hypothetical protein
MWACAPVNGDADPILTVIDESADVADFSGFGGGLSRPQPADKTAMLKAQTSAGTSRDMTGASML